MNLLPGVVRITSSSNAFITSNTPLRIYGVHLVSIPTASTLTLVDGIISATGVTLARIDGAASQGVTVNFNGGLVFSKNAICITDANLSFATIIYSREQ